MAMRPSTVQRLHNFRTLVAEFAARDLGYGEAGVLLDCSTSGARNYVNRLLEAGVVVQRRTRGADGKDLTVFRLNPDPHVARGFLAMMARQQRVDALLPRQASAARSAAAVARFPAAPVAPPGCDDADDAPARRDPLVAALFGLTRGGTPA
jgi:hypothetical protein